MTNDHRNGNCGNRDAGQQQTVTVNQLADRLRVISYETSCGEKYRRPYPSRRKREQRVSPERHTVQPDDVRHDVAHDREKIAYA